MAHNQNKTHRSTDDSYIENNFEDSLLDSPPKKLPIRNATLHTRNTSTQQPSRQNDSNNDQHEGKLRQELANVRKVNQAIEGVLESLEKAKSNMKNVYQTVNNASSLLNIWTRILSQTEHSQRLILDSTWQGASQDIADMEEEAQAKELAAERREAEEQERRAAAARKAEEEEKRRSEASSTAPKSKPTARNRGSLTRGTNAHRAGYVAMGGTSSTAMPGPGRGSISTRRTTNTNLRGPSSRGLRGRG